MYVQKVDPSADAFFPTMIFVPAQVRIGEAVRVSNKRIALKIEEFRFFMSYIFFVVLPIYLFGEF